MIVPSKFLFAARFGVGDFRPVSWEGASDAPRLAPAFQNFSVSDPQYFIPPQSGVAANGLPIFNWNQAATQLTRDSNGWGGVLGASAVVTYGYRSSAPGTMPSDIGGFQRFTLDQIAMTEEALALWSDVANITFMRIENLDGYTNNATMLFGNNRQRAVCQDQQRSNRRRSGDRSSAGYR
jgi:hypothetical protein